MSDSVQTKDTITIHFISKDGKKQAVIVQEQLGEYLRKMDKLMP